MPVVAEMISGKLNDHRLGTILQTTDFYPDWQVSSVRSVVRTYHFRSVTLNTIVSHLLEYFSIVI